MYGSDLVVGGRSLEAVEQALRSVLPTLGLEVTRVVEVANVSERYEVSGEASSVSFGMLHEGVYGIAVRGPRAPHWNNELARRLSQALGGFAAGRVSDRLYDDYGYGYFLDGHSIEWAMKNRADEVDAFGIHPHITGKVIAQRLDEDENNRTFKQNLEQLSRPFVSPWPPRGSFRVMLVEGDARVAAVPPPPHFVLAVATGYKERIQLTGEERELDPSWDTLEDGGLDEEPRRALVVRSRFAPAEVMDAIAEAGCVAFVTDGKRKWIRSEDSGFVEMEREGLKGFLRAWSAVERRSGLYALDVTFLHAPKTSPWR